MIDPIIVEFLNAKAAQYEKPDFVVNDPINIPRRYDRKEDIEIAGFLTSTIAWGQRQTIMKNANRIMAFMDDAPYDFIVNHEKSDLKRCHGFVHRTFNAEDLKYFFSALKRIYSEHGGLEKVFSVKEEETSTLHSISRMRQCFFGDDLNNRSQKHVSNPVKGSAAKRLNMFLRWMVRDGKNGVDFGIWKTIPMSKLSIPLDVHTGNIGRQLNLLLRRQNDWKAVLELDNALRSMDPLDPVKYDFALFGIGVNKDLTLNGIIK